MTGRSSLDSIATASPVAKKSTRQPRSFSASEIARNVKNFETWSTYQACEEVAFSDVPEELRADIIRVFETDGFLPASWVDKSSKIYRRMKRTSSSDFMAFIQDAYTACPSLFSDAVSADDSWELREDLSIVFSAWKRLRRMRSSKEKVSEADFVANVYEVFRGAALPHCSYRSKCSMSLPQPLQHARPRTQAVRILNAKTVIPDCAVFIPAADIRHLSHSAKSPFKKLKRSSLTGSAGNGESSFGSQSTPCAQLPGTPSFEFISSVWEDKKPMHQMLEDAYRQNRMATTAAVRHLYSLHIKAPVFGLLWSDGTVRAHVDWCLSEVDKPPTVQSAPFPGLDHEDEANKDVFHEWRLDQPGDIIQVFLLIRNIDRWTVGRFRERVTSGVQELVHSVLTERRKFKPWKRAGILVPTIKAEVQDQNSCSNTSGQHSSPETKPKRRGRRRS